MAGRMRAFDWSSSNVGAVAGWPTSLRTMVGVVLASRFPMLLFWGPELNHLYNDAYRPILGNKHPASLGAPAALVWPEIWHIIGPQAESVLAGGPATWNEDLFLPVNRKGYVEETYFTFSYSGVPDDHGGVGGVLVTAKETTEQVQARRQLEMLRGLAAASDAKTPAEACRAAAEVLATNDADVPFALFYLLDDAGARADLAATVGLASEGCAPARVGLSPGDPKGPWPLWEARRSAVLEVEVRERTLGPLPAGRFGHAPERAVILPLDAGTDVRPYGFLVAGVNPLRALDERYRELYRLTAERVATAIRSAREFEEQRKRAESLAEIDRAKTVFFSNVSHEFRTPLTLMLGPTEDLIRGVYGELTAAQREQLELLRRNELRLQRLVNALLEFSRIEAGRSRARYERVDLALLTRDIASAFRAGIERAGLTFIVDCPALADDVAVDVGMWEQIVMNLLSNAFKFTFEGTIRIALRKTEGEIVLAVEDTGVGVSAEDLPRLFDRFHRVEGTRARTHEGSGIGLALVRELVRLHGGAVRVDSAFGAGTTFTVTIPERAGAEIPAAAAPAPALGPTFVEEALRWGSREARPSIERGSSGAARVLVVDDNADMRDYLRRILEPRWIVELAADGGDALAAARARRPDVVLSDVMMPTIDGLRLLAALRADPETRDIPVVLLSARAGEESRVEGLDAGADDYLVKPFSARELVARVALHVGASRLRRSLELERAKLRAIIESSPAAICVLRGPEHVFELANPPFSRLVGGRSLVGLPIRQALPEIESQGYLELLDRVYQTGEPQCIDEARIMLDATGEGAPEEQFFHLTYLPSHSIDGAVDGVLVFGFIVTDHVLARRRTESAVALRDEFFSIASHELRTPLTTLGLHVDGLVRSLSREEVSATSIARWLDRAHKLRAQADRLEHLIEDVFEAAAILPARAEEPPEPLDLAEVARDVVGRLRHASKRAHEIELSADSIVGTWDRAHIERLLEELLSNALKFGKNRTISVTVGPAEDTDAGARLVVADQGMGIAPADHRRIFERFERAASAEHFGGFGLGLFHVRELVQSMRGTVDLESEPDRGARFVVRLPRSS